MADQGSEGILSPFLRNKRFEAARSHLSGKVLDFGCGAGGLATWIPDSSYVGIDKDEESLKVAKSRFPNHQFVPSLAELNEKFDTIVSLAVIEHYKKPAEFLRELSNYLNGTESKIIITTPHPFVDKIHELGSHLGLFSKHANEEHEELLNRRKLELYGKEAGLKLSSYKRFLYGANQLAVFKKEIK